jgi:hypothetical protein
MLGTTRGFSGFLIPYPSSMSFNTGVVPGPHLFFIIQFSANINTDNSYAAGNQAANQFSPIINIGRVPKYLPD